MLIYHQNPVIITNQVNFIQIDNPKLINKISIHRFVTLSICNLYKPAKFIGQSGATHRANGAAN